MTHTHVKMPQKLSAKDLDGIVYVFTKMSLASKQAFISSLMVDHPEHHKTISNAIGELYYESMAQA